MATTTYLIYFSLQNSRMIFSCFLARLEILILGSHFPSQVSPFSFNSLIITWFQIPSLKSFSNCPSSCVDLSLVSFPDSYFSYLENAHILFPPLELTDQAHTTPMFLVLISLHFLSSPFDSFQIWCAVGCSLHLPLLCNQGGGNASISLSSPAPSVLWVQSIGTSHPPARAESFPWCPPSIPSHLFNNLPHTNLWRPLFPGLPSIGVTLPLAPMKLIGTWLPCVDSLLVGGSGFPPFVEAEATSGF